jgi:hypothetical protein
MAYRRELWLIVSGSEVRFMCNITMDTAFSVWVDNGDGLVFVMEVLDCWLNEDVEGLT